MFDYLVKFNKLPQELREEVSSPLVMQAIDELEERFKVNLATIIMRVMVKEIAFDDLKQFFIEENGLSDPMAEQLQLELAGRVFLKVADYLGIDLEAVLAKSEQVEQPQNSPDIMTVERTSAPSPASQVRGAQFFFSPEDEEEIRALTMNTDNAVKPASLENLEDRITKIITKSEINFGSEELVNRFRVILRTYLRGVRNRLDTKLTLTKHFDSGGLSFDSDSAENVLKLADDSERLLAEEPMKKPPLIPVPEDAALGRTGTLAGLRAIGARDIEYDLAKELAKRDAEKKEIKPSNNLNAYDQVVVPPIGNIVPSRNDKPAPEIALSTPSSVPEMEPLTIKRPLDAGNKVKMEDIKYVPKSMGLVEELKYMDLESFRRLEKEPNLIIEKIKNKINLLEDESYSQRLEGIKVWRQNQVNKLYLELGEAAIANNKPVEIIIEERRTAGQETLTEAEFEAIMQLNRHLRF